MNVWALIKTVPRVFRTSEELGQKGWYASKTIWFNVLVLVLDIAIKGFGHDLPVSSEAVDAVAGGCAAVGNIVLRLVTTTPVAMQTVRKGQDG